MKIKINKKRKRETMREGRGWGAFQQFLCVLTDNTQRLEIHCSCQIMFYFIFIFNFTFFFQARVKVRN